MSTPGPASSEVTHWKCCRCKSWIEIEVKVCTSCKPPHEKCGNCDEQTLFNPLGRDSMPDLNIGGNSRRSQQSQHQGGKSLQKKDKHPRGSSHQPIPQSSHQQQPPSTPSPKPHKASTNASIQNLLKTPSPKPGRSGASKKPSIANLTSTPSPSGTHASQHHASGHHQGQPSSSGANTGAGNEFVYDENLERWVPRSQFDPEGKRRAR
ncbi:hypothetical protein QBC38DRAFT_527970 [Podospora fimiseda]|uniref:Uncharacterized protein n=1 Tax=Podospora fimiseda TaxID=252190 RepID=A0AAN7BP30_9PEZI|nr:hypothetical protein QBC38DRAFT_527970 [Podospora fimiseda]